MTRKRTVDPIPPDVQQFVVDVGRLTILENALRDIEEETEGIDYAVASYRELQETLKRCRQTAREALGEENATDGGQQES